MRLTGTGKRCEWYTVLPARRRGRSSFPRLQAGDKIEIVGPLGNGFPLEKAAGKRAMLMGGGIGVPPILELAKELAGELEPGTEDDRRRIPGQSDVF